MTTPTDAKALDERFGLACSLAPHASRGTVRKWERAVRCRRHGLRIAACQTLEALVELYRSADPFVDGFEQRFFEDTFDRRVEQLKARA